MKSVWLRTLSLLTMIFTLNSHAVSSPETTNPQVELDTSAGVIVLELMPQQAPLSVKNFLDYVNSGFYEGVIFHRVIKGFMVQTGGFEPGMKKKEPRGPVKNEASNGLSNVRGTIAMARTNNPDSATSQFFINEKDNTFLDHSTGNPGYTVFGRVSKGIDVVDRIASTPTHKLGFYSDVPEKDVVINKARVLQPDSKTVPAPVKPGQAAPAPQG